MLGCLVVIVGDVESATSSSSMEDERLAAIANNIVLCLIDEQRRLQRQTVATTFHSVYCQIQITAVTTTACLTDYFWKLLVNLVVVVVGEFQGHRS